jgi:hypothetical protein
LEIIIFGKNTVWKNNEIFPREVRVKISNSFQAPGTTRKIMKFQSVQPPKNLPRTADPRREYPRKKMKFSEKEFLPKIEFLAQITERVHREDSSASRIFGTLDDAYDGRSQ